jgi:hypothetical protein
LVTAALSEVIARSIGHASQPASALTSEAAFAPLHVEAQSALDVLATVVAFAPLHLEAQSDDSSLTTLAVTPVAFWHAEAQSWLTSLTVVASLLQGFLSSQGPAAGDIAITMTAEQQIAPRASVFRSVIITLYSSASGWNSRESVLKPRRTRASRVTLL